LRPLGRLLIGLTKAGYFLSFRASAKRFPLTSEIAESCAL
jgi:hypothetical protein